MKRCSLCKNRVQEDDMEDITSPGGGRIRNVCSSCIDDLEFAFSCEMAKIKDRTKVMYKGRKS